MHSDINSNLEYADKFCNNNNNNDNNIYINESTRRYEANVLFRKLVDKCAKINLYNTDGMPIINSKNIDQHIVKCFVTNTKLYDYCYVVMIKYGLNNEEIYIE